jgi:hypothetical protein
MPVAFPTLSPPTMVVSLTQVLLAPTPATSNLPLKYSLLFHCPQMLMCVIPSLLTLTKMPMELTFLIRVQDILITHILKMIKIY